MSGAQAGTAQQPPGGGVEQLAAREHGVGCTGAETNGDGAPIILQLGVQDGAYAGCAQAKAGGGRDAGGCSAPQLLAARAGLALKAYRRSRQRAALACF